VEKTKTKQTNKKIPSSNAVQFQFVLQHPVLILSLSHQSQKEKKVWRQLCECLSEAVAHLPPTVSQLLLQALFIVDLKNELYTHLALQDLFM
jgi:hypothetical protein